MAPMRTVPVLLTIALATFPASAAEPDRTTRLLEELTNAPGPSGFEGPVRDVLSRELRAAGAEVSTDGLGSVIGVIKGVSAEPRIMLVAHMDEVGLMVRRITDDGFLKVQPLGGIVVKSLPDKRWTIQTHRGSVTAISGLKSAHITSSDEAHSITEIDDLFLDVGARSREDVERLGVRVGDPVAPWNPFTVLANERYAAKAFDDRVGVAMLVETARRLRDRGIRLPGTVYFVGSVQEEVGYRGATTATERVRPHIGIALEVGVAGDHPGVGADEASSGLGEGPSMFLYEASMLPNLALRDVFIETARRHETPLQFDVIARYGQDSSVVQRHGTGTPAIAFGVPTRYLHTFTSVIDRRDFDRAVDLLIEVLRQLDSAAVEGMTRF